MWSSPAPGSSSKFYCPLKTTMIWSRPFGAALFCFGDWKVSDGVDAPRRHLCARMAVLRTVSFHARQIPADAKSGRGLSPLKANQCRGAGLHPLGSENDVIGTRQRRDWPKLARQGAKRDKRLSLPLRIFHRRPFYMNVKKFVCSGLNSDALMGPNRYLLPGYLRRY